jgi:hypothetical protein
MNSPRITYIQRPDATPEAELNVLANVYRFILDCHAKQEGGPATAPTDAMKGSKHDRASTYYTR